MTKTIKITKLDAARRQLETSILLYFQDRDGISIHTLTCAAHQILIDMGGGSVMKEEITKMVRPEKQKEWLMLINKAENFFKHADKDPNSILDFAHLSTQHLLWDACMMYAKITWEITEYMKIFVSWFFIQNQDLLIQDDHKEKAKKVEGYWKTKQDFFKEMVTLSGEF